MSSRVPPIDLTTSSPIGQRNGGGFDSIESARLAVERLARDQCEIYRRQPKELISHANRETSTIDGYRGRQLLELLQNADDAAAGSLRARLLIEIKDGCVVVANSGVAFSQRGLESLVISDCSPKQLDRNRYIGCKGLGFRSILTWSEQPLIASGHLHVAFDRARAHAAVEALARESDVLRTTLEEFDAADGARPVPIMRFPFVPEAEDLALAKEYRERGFDTVVLLRLPPRDRRDRVLQDVLAQIDAFQSEALLFCRSLTEVHLNGRAPRRWDVRREELSRDRARLVIQGFDGEKHWTVHRREGRIDPSARSRSSPRDFETAVAVPDQPTLDDTRCLCVFFPTQDSLPLPLVLHASLELSDDRNRVHNTDDNRQVLAALAVQLADVVEAEAAVDPKRALRLLDGLDRADPELERLGFRADAVAAIRSRSVFPRIDRTLGPAQDSYRVPHDSWHLLLSHEHFPEVLDVRNGEKLAGLLDLFEIGWFEQDELMRRLRMQLATLQPESAGELVGRLLATDRLGKFPLGSFILTSDGHHLDESAHHCFFAPSSQTYPVPAWARGIRFVDPAFQRGLQSAAGVASLRALSERLGSRQATVDEYRLETVVRAIVTHAQEVATERASRTRELLRWLFDTTSGEPGSLTGVAVPILGADGAICKPSDCYLGPDMPGGELLHRLYSGIAGIRFVASRSELGLGHASKLAAQRFLVALGVRERPKPVGLTPSESRALAEQALEALEYPSRVRGEECADFAAAMALLREIGIEGGEVPQALQELLITADPAALVGYLLGDGQAFLASETNAGAYFVAKKSREWRMWRDPSIGVPNPVVLALRSTAWVPTTNGARCTPGQVMLSSAGRRLLHGLFFQHAIDTNDPAVQRGGGQRGVHGLLTRLGAISSLDAIDTDSLYELLSRLPEHDPEGRHAPGIYRTLVDAGVTPDDGPAKRRFLKDGRVWSKHRDGPSYLPVADLRYNANLSIPQVIEQHLKLAELPKRKSSKLVRDLFGIASLAPKDITLELLSDGTEYDYTSEDANAAFRRALPYVYAIRLGRKIDEDNRERNLLANAELRLCTRIAARATLPDGEVQRIELSNRGDRLLLDRSLYVIDRFERDAASHVRFWQGIANLVAELLGTDVAAEAANVFRCRNVAEMEDVVLGLVDDKAPTKLAAAKERFRAASEPEPEEPRAIPAAIEPSVDEVATSTSVPLEVSLLPADEDSGVSKDFDENRVGFVPIAAPARNSGSRRALVITRGADSRPAFRRGPLATEDVTFRVVEQYERHEGRFPIRVSHIHGSDGFGCDLLSLDSEDALARATESGIVRDETILRYIEVKGRSSRAGQIELTDNELRRAEREAQRYFLYRVFRDPDHTTQFEIGVLADPVNSKAVRQVTRFDLAEGSGAQWYQMVTESHDDSVA